MESWGSLFRGGACKSQSRASPQPSYNSPVNNKYMAGWDNVSYDAKGDLTQDPYNTYTWDVYGDLATANGVVVTYDAYSRMVENNNGTYQFVYDPVGTQVLAKMAGQTLFHLYEPLPGGAVAVYGSAASLEQYNHGDWLGSGRLYSTPSRSAVVPTMAYAPFGEGYAGNVGWIQFTGVTGSSWTVVDGENNTGSLDDFMYRRYSPTQGRWISPDPSGLNAVDPNNPQSWNRYAYVLNNPLSYRDPLGLDCAYLNDNGDGIESTDQSSNAGECGSNGGYWVDGGLTDYQINSQSGSVQLWGTNTGMDQNGNQSYTYAQYQDTTLNVGWFMNTGWNPFGHIGIGIGNNPFVGLNPASDMQFLGSLTGHLFGCVGRAGCNALANTAVPGVISPENPNQSPLQNVSIPITGMQANMIQSAINGSTVYPPNYSVMGPQPACDCGTWAQQMMLAGGLQSGAPAPVPAYLIEQLNQIYNPW
jgi:RHS repeat-associated protein